MRIVVSFTMSGIQESRVRITRARAASGLKLPSEIQADQKKPRAKAPKRGARDENEATANSMPAKRRAVLGDVSNLCNKENAPVDCMATGKSQVAAQSNSSKGRSRSKKKEARAVPVKKEVLSASVETATPIKFNSFTDQSSKPAECQKPGGNPPVIISAEQRSLPKPFISGNRAHAKHSEGLTAPSCLLHTDIDRGNTDPQMCSTYVQDIYDHLRIAELKKRPSANFMESVQMDITPSMRGILVDWLVEVAEEYKLVPDTLYLTVSYIDRFLSANPVNRQKLQLLGVSCMLIASKYEEICPPHVEEFCYITDNTYTREEMLAMERKILSFMHFEMTMPTSKSFLRRFIRAAQAGNRTPGLHMEFLANYLAELTLLECSFLKYLPSLIAASAVFVSRLTLDPGTHPWNLTLQHYTGYKPSNLKECACAIYDLQINRKNCTLTAVREKYRQHKFKCVANLFPSPHIPPRFFEDIEPGLCSGASELNRDTMPCMSLAS